VIHFISEGALIGGIARLANDEPTTIGTAWGLGRQLAWTYVGLFLLAISLALALALAVGIVVAVIVVIGHGNQGLAAALGIILGLIGLAIGIPVAIAASIVVAYAQRAIAVDALGPLGAVERGIVLLRARLGSSLALWLVSLVVTIGAGIAVVIGLFI